MNRPAYDRYSFVSDGSPEMTPLIDCVMLLLVFFMVTTAFFSLKAIQVTMPGVSEGAAVEQTAEINVYVTSGGQVQVDGRTIPLDRLQDAFAEAARTEGRTALVLEAAEPVVHQQVVDVLDRARGAGITEIAFARPQEAADGP